jgi:hypothetical protein
MVGLGSSAYLEPPARRSCRAPFANLGGNKESVAFAADIQNDILTRLAHNDDLNVTSRTSVMTISCHRFRDVRHGVLAVVEDFSPHGKMSSSPVRTIVPCGRGISPYGGLSLPYGKRILPCGEGFQSCVEMILPCGKGVPPYGAIGLPCGGMFPTRVRKLLPCGSVLLPCVMAIVPYGMLGLSLGRMLSPCV